MAKIRVGVVGTSWWADAMYLPALDNHPEVVVSAVCGRSVERAEAFAERWNVPHVYTDYRELLASGKVDAVVVATINQTHYVIAMAALRAGLHVLCEKPLGMTYGEAKEMAQTARAQDVKTLVPFTYRFMPTNRYLKQLIDDGFIGTPYHCAMRYYTGYGRTPEYRWRFDRKMAGSGVIGDLGSHFLYLAEWFFGNISAVSCQTARHIQRAPLDHAGQPYTQLEDSAMFLLQFASGAQANIHVTCMAHEQTQFGQRHFSEFHGAEGTLYSQIDWNTVQEVCGARAPDGKLETLPIPDTIWGSVRRDNVHETYKDVFRKELRMIGDWIDGIVENTAVSPNFDDGARIQRVMSAALLSAHEHRRVEIEEILN